MAPGTSSDATYCSMTHMWASPRNSLYDLLYYAMYSTCMIRAWLTANDKIRHWLDPNVFLIGDAGECNFDQ